MAEIDLSALVTPGLLTAAVGASGAFGRWALKLWATVRREGVVAEAAAAAKREAFDAAAAKRREDFETAMATLQRADNARMIDALLAQASSNASLAGKLEALNSKLDTLVEWRERPTPVEFPAVDEEGRPRRIDPESERRRKIATRPQGVRVPKAGTHHDREG